MALVISTNNGTSSVTATKNIPVQNIVWTDWAASSRSGDSIVLRNGNAGFTTPNVVRIERSRIANVYSGSGIVANYQLPTKDGVKLFIQSNAVFSMTDSEDPTFLTYLPYVANLTLRVPSVPYGYVSLANVNTVLQQLFACITRTSGNNTEGGLFNLLNGVLDPAAWAYPSAAATASE